MAISAFFKGGKQFINSISSLGADIRGGLRKEFLDELGRYMVNSTEKGILEQRSPDGKKYAPLSPRTVKRRSQLILVDTRQMINSIKFRKVSGRVTTGRVEISPQGSRTGSRVTNQQLGVFHQLGTKKMPARPFMGLNRAHNDLGNIDRIAKKFIEQAAQRAFKKR